MNPIKVDPTRTGRIQKRAVKEMFARLNAVREKIIEQIGTKNALGIGLDLHPVGPMFNTEWAFMSDPQKTQAFRDWITLLFQESVLQPYGNQRVDTPWLAEYLDITYRQSIRQAFQQARSGVFALGTSEQSQLTSSQFVEAAFNAPIARNQLQMLYQRAYDHLDGISKDMSKEMSRVITQGLVDGSHERQIARRLSDVVNISRTRAESIVRTEIVHTHAEAMLDTYEMIGVEDVNIMAEYNTAGDDRVCARCAALEGIIMTIEEARGLIPRHSRCRCSFLPANIGETQFRGKVIQRRNKKDIQKRIKKSLLAERKSKISLERAISIAKWPGARLLE